MRHNWHMLEGAVDNNTIEQIVKDASERQTEKATTFGLDGDDIRSSRVAWLSDHKPLLDFLYDFVDHSNQSAFNFNIFKKAEIQYTEYHASEQGHYAWHHDVDWTRHDGLDRKISITVQLSDPSEYEGGYFEFGDGVTAVPEEARTKGTVLIFPSYIAHKVSPITSGVRRSLVAWFEGPTWK